MKNRMRCVLLTALKARLVKFNDWKYDDLLSFFKLYRACGLFLYEKKEKRNTVHQVSLAARIAADASAFQKFTKKDLS